ncbi:MAG: N-acetyltransferase family protein [Spirochaetia bacterium]
MDVGIRKAAENDLEQILAIYRDAGIETHGRQSLESARGAFRRMASYPSYSVYVAEVDGSVEGTFALLIMDNLANGGLPSGIVEDVAVLRSSQGKGIGKAMMQSAIGICRDFKCYKMALSSNTARSGAHRFYESLGFVRHGFSYRVDISP